MAAVDKFRGTATASEVAAAIARGAEAVGASCQLVPLADGGEGTLDALGGPNRSTVVMGPLGDPVEAPWRLDDGDAVIEMALASGIALVGGPEYNDPIAATTHGTGELITAAIEQGARRIIVGMGGSASTDGGLGALRGIWAPARLKGVELIAACDVRTHFVDAARVFAPQKGATPAQVEFLTRRLERLLQVYANDYEYGAFIADLDGGGAAGGLGGGLAAVGADLVSGFELIAEEHELEWQMPGADLVVTGEGFIDAQSFEGKIVGHVIEIAKRVNRPVLAIAGQIYDGVDENIDAVSLVDRFGEDRARSDTTNCIAEVVTDHLRKMG